MPSIRHIHKYKRVRQGRNKDYIIFRCTLVNCTHYLSKEFLIGKEGICWSCNNKFVFLSARDLILKPKCQECSGRAIKVDADISKLLRDLKVI